MVDIKSKIFDLIFPLECLNCGKEGSYLCEKCFNKLKINKKQYCFGCKSLNDYGEFCKICKEKYSLNGILIAGNYDDKILSDLIKTLKYKFSLDIAEILSQFLSFFLKEKIKQTKIDSSDIKNFLNNEKVKQIKKSPLFFSDFFNTAIIPVPLHKKRENWRGFNQSELIALDISKILKIPVLPGLKRKIHKKPQAKLNEKQRIINIKNCFAWEGSDIYKKNIILIDDVATTGSTLNECARILKKAGAGEIWGLVLAKG
jgi:ComF family protein